MWKASIAALAVLVALPAYADSVTQIYRDPNGNYTQFNGDGSVSQAYRGPNGSYTIFNGRDDSVDQLYPNGNGGYTVFHSGGRADPK